MGQIILQSYDTRCLQDVGTSYLNVIVQNGELSSLEEYFNEEDPLDYTPEYKDVVIQRNLYSDAQSGMLFYAFAQCTCVL